MPDKVKPEYRFEIDHLQNRVYVYLFERFEGRWFAWVHGDGDTTESAMKSLEADMLWAKSVNYHSIIHIPQPRTVS
jgi:hypothetical protein